MAQLDFFRPPPTPWNAWRIIGPKPPLKPKHVWAIRQQLKNTRRVRDLALFACAIDAKLRGCVLSAQIHGPLTEAVETGFHGQV